MTKGKFKGPKDPFSALPESFKDAVAAMGTDELHKRLSDISKDEEINKAAKKADKDLKSKMAEAQVAGRQYKEKTKLNDLATKYVMRNLADKGDVKSSQYIQLSVDAA